MDKAGNITHRRKTKGLHILMDGGLTGNFPIKIFDSTKYLITQPNIFTVNPKTIGFRIDSDEQIENDKAGKGLAAADVANLRDYMKAFYTMVIENLNRQALTAADWQRTVSISDGRIGPRIRRLSETEIRLLVSNGRTATALYFKNR
jgi:NTE family protein